MIIKPQEGPQEDFLSTRADVAIYGGAAGGGKSYALILEPLRHIDNPLYRATIFRHNYNQITNQGGLWDESREVYTYVRGAQARTSPKYGWTFRSGARVSFAHIERDDDCKNWQGSQICMIGFDELTHFSEYQFFYMLSRNRSICGVKPYVRATCNPDADSWVAEFISWWIDQKTGYPIKERSGVLRWFVRLDNTIIWFDDYKSAYNSVLEQGYDKNLAKEMPKSCTFIMSTLDDNQLLLKKNPQYKANLLAMSEVEMERLYKGNWKIKPQAGLFFKRSQVTVIDKQPSDITTLCRAWDLAATSEDENGDAAYTAGVLMGMCSNGRFVILDVINQRLEAGGVRTLLLNTCKADNAQYGYVRTRIPQDPGQAGKAQSIDIVHMLAGYDAVARLESGSKESRAEPVAAQWQHGFFDVMQGAWNNDYFQQLESFPESKFKDMVDATSSAFNELTQQMQFNINNML